MSILNRLPEKENAYLLLDGAQFESVERWLYQHTDTPEYHLIYKGTELANARDVSPCLVDLSRPEHRHLADQFAASSNANQSGILLSTFADTSQDDLIEHLTSLIFASGEITTKAVFRWYDPRVSKHLLKHSSDSECSELLGPIHTVFLSTIDGWEDYSNTHKSHRKNTPYILKEHQYEALTYAADEVYQQRLVEHLNNHFPQLMQSHSASAQKQLSIKWIEKGKALGFEDQLSLTLFSNTLALLGTDCLDEKKTHHPEITKLLTAKSQQTPAQRIEQASELAAKIAAEQSDKQLKEQLEETPATGTES